MGRTQSAISQKIIRLEDALQMRMFERTSRTLTLTRDGERVLTAVRRLLDRYEAFLQEVFEPPRVTVLRLGVAENLIQMQLPDLLSRLRSLDQDMQLELTADSSGNLREALRRRALDVIVVGACGKPSTPRGRVIWTEPLVWASAAGYVDDPRQPARVVMMQPPCIYREIIGSALGSVPREWASACTVNNLTGLHAAVLGGLGVTVLGRSQVRGGMKIMRASRCWPALSPIRVEVIGDRPEMEHLIERLIAVISEGMGASSIRG